MPKITPFYRVFTIWYNKKGTILNLKEFANLSEEYQIQQVIKNGIEDGKDWADILCRRRTPFIRKK